MRFLIFFGLIWFLSFSTKAQEVLLSENVKGDTVRSNFGPNKTHYLIMYTGIGFFVSPSNKGSDVNPYSSSDYRIGARYKLKLCSWEAIGFDVYYNTNNFNLKQNDQKTIPNKTLHDKEKVVTNNVAVDLFNRINFGKRGNVLGKYLDLGFYFSYYFASKHVYKDTFTSANSAFATRNKVVNRGMKYFSDYNYGPIMRIGNNRYTLYAQYRMTPYFIQGFNFADMPIVVAGIQVGLHK